MIKENEIHFYEDIERKIRYRRPLDNALEQTALIIGHKKHIYFKTKGYLLTDGSGRKLLNNPITFLDAVTAWALVPKSTEETVPFEYFITNEGIAVNLHLDVNYDTYQRAIPGFSYSEEAVRKMKPELVKIELHDSYFFQDPPDGLTRYDVLYGNNLINNRIGIIAVDKRLKSVKVSSWLSSWSKIVFQDKSIKEKDTPITPPHNDELLKIFQQEVKNTVSTLSPVSLKINDNVKAVLKASIQEVAKRHGVDDYNIEI